MNANELHTITARLAKVARETLPEHILKQGGRVLYTPVKTLVSSSPVYFLGANPGEVPGSLESHNTFTVESDIQRIEVHSVTGHALLDESWKNKAAGQAPIQKRTQKVFSIITGGNAKVGIELLRKTPCSNFAFPRSISTKEIGNIESLALQCWPFHKTIIQLIKPHLVLTHAIVIADYLAKKLGWGSGEKRPSGHGGLPNCYAWKLPEGPVLLAIPNLSRYSPDKERETALNKFFNEFAQNLANYH